MKNTNKGKHTPYNPKTCPFCHFYGIRKNKDDWSCDMCGLKWDKNDDPRTKEYQCHKCGMNSNLFPEYHTTQGLFYIIQCTACNYKARMHHSLTTNEFIIDYDFYKVVHKKKI